ncbi:hypothetical protein TraAM80_02750 [Trypanosoma rangeli]|uniref:Uncharacterized protein n=1 Tax=Trypanosoma rangeli TaxID=5698 RepID=A0A3R7MMV5_TRYRA|nr:uncharacterized protein TraAM80_02750 [Trypanosoma rangeli]RNF08447.1 hypothetical protein TraAM80_02750 [Trypanosoma rangeli]|eukprot:RNF08447.1 hypothetical protein TraAM80_02750 [Trypanosoma rangeli]
MEASAINSPVEDDATLAKDAQQFLTVIADMQYEAERRRLILDELRQKETAAKAELEKCLVAREALVARMAHTKAEGLELQVEYNGLCSRQRAAEAEALELRHQKAHWMQLLQLYQTPSTQPSSPIRTESDDSDGTHGSDTPQLSRAFNAWIQLPHSFLFLRVLKTTLTEFMTELQMNTRSTSDEVISTIYNDASTDHTTAASDLATIFPHLPSLGPLEKAVLSLVSFFA